MVYSTTESHYCDLLTTTTHCQSSQGVVHSVAPPFSPAQLWSSRIPCFTILLHNWGH
jgi:hypothetical protein